MVQGSLNSNISILGEKLWPVAWNKKITSVIYEEMQKRKNDYFEKQKMCFFSCPRDHSNQKLGS